MENQEDSVPERRQQKGVFKGEPSQTEPNVTEMSRRGRAERCPLDTSKDGFRSR